MDNEVELQKIQKATSGWLKKSARQMITLAINEMKPYIEEAKTFPEPEKMERLKLLLEKATYQRHSAIQSGANSYGHAKWAAAAACESWLFELINGNSDSISRVEALIDELRSR